MINGDKHCKCECGKSNKEYYHITLITAMLAMYKKYGKMMKEYDLEDEIPLAGKMIHDFLVTEV
jgi:hypothetical protein